MLPLLLFIRLLGYTQATALTWGNPGLISLFTDGRIVGGEETTIESFPHQVSLRYFSWHRCGGSIVKPNVIVTAAHCVDGIPLINMAFVAGSSDVTSGGETRKLSKSIVHENYNDWTLDSDIAVVILQSGFDFSSKIQPIALASVNEDLRAGTRVLVSGWGTVSENGAEPDILRYVAINIIASEDCGKAYEDTRAISENMLCAGVDGGGKDACQGDSGGPLIEGQKLYGIVSWGKGCARSEYPGVFTRVASFRGWIDEKIVSFG